MPEPLRRPLSRVRTAVTGRRVDGVARTVERRERPQWQGLFVEPDWPRWPAEDEEETDV